MSAGNWVRILAFGLVFAAAGALSTGRAPAQDRQAWTVPRTAAGDPDLQGNWTNGTITPVQRPDGQGPVLTAEQVAAVEGGVQQFIDASSQPSDPDREAPPAGGVSTGGGALLDAAAGGTGGYNIFWLDQGDRVAVFNGEPRSSLITRPDNGRIPSLAPQAQQRMREAFAARSRFGEYDNPENRPLGERCLMSFGSNAGPPMLPNYFYNNNYTIVQTPDHVMILTEMVHDVRIIPIRESKPVSERMRPWMGVSWGRWAGDTLVVETTNVRQDQLDAYPYLFPGGSENMKVIERFTRADELTINYEFTVEDPDTYTSAWGGEVPFRKMDDLVYEYACHEGNYAMSNVLSGARAEERETGNPR